MSASSELLKKYLQAGEKQLALGLIQDVASYEEGELFVFAVLTRQEKDSSHPLGSRSVLNEQADKDLVEAALKAFASTHHDQSGAHGFWVHSLSHFSKFLWQAELFDLIKRFNQIAFEGAVRTGDYFCSDRLIFEFANNARWHDDPLDFYLAPEILEHRNWDEDQESEMEIRERIQAAPFRSEADFLLWELLRPSRFQKFDSRLWMNLIDHQSIMYRLGKLQKMNIDISSYIAVLADQLNQQLIKLNDKLKEEKDGNKLKKLKSVIETTESQLAELQNGGKINEDPSN